MCPFEVLHFLPLVLIAVTIFALNSSFNKISVLACIALLSLIGLGAGYHVHFDHDHAHFESVAFFDPCVGYVVSLIISIFGLVKKAAFAKKA